MHYIFSPMLGKVVDCNTIYKNYSLTQLCVFNATKIHFKKVASGIFFCNYVFIPKYCYEFSLLACTIYDLRGVMEGVILYKHVLVGTNSLSILCLIS